MSQIDLLSRVTAELIEKEERSYDVRQQTLVSLVRANYDVWTAKLFPMLKSRGASCYEELVKLLGRPEVGINTSREALRNAFQTVRDERNRAKGSGVIHAADRAQRQRYSLDEPEAMQRSKSTGASSENGLAVQRIAEPVIQPRRVVSTPPKRCSGQPVDAGSTDAPSVASGHITWSVDPNQSAVFCGEELSSTLGVVRALAPVKSRIEKVAERGNKEDVLACLAFLKAFNLAKDFHSSGEGPTLRPLNWLAPPSHLVASLQTRLKSVW